jgi:dinuclear metal center YbgI/SA1388 family protein
MERTTVGDMLRALGAIAPADKAADWDPVGLQVGDPEADGGAVAVCHEVSDEVIDAVLALPERPALLVSYHPLLFRPVTSLVAGKGPEGRALRLAAAAVALAVIHTNWDAVPGGAADALCASLGIEEPVPFGPIEAGPTVKVVTFAPAESADTLVEAMADAGAGRIGRYSRCSFRTPGSGSFLGGDLSDPVVGTAGSVTVVPEVRVEMLAPAARRDAVLAAMVSAHPYEEPAFDVIPTISNLGFVGRVGIPQVNSLARLAAMVAERLDAVGLRVAGDLERPLGRVAVIPGSGGDLLGAAIAAGADAVVTGDVRHHSAVSAVARRVAVVDAGHTATERPGMRALYAAIRSMEPGAIDLTHFDPTPWRDLR